MENRDLKTEKGIIIYFSRAGENYVSNSETTGIKTIEKGNTEILAEMLKEITKSKLFKIEPVNEYPADYHKCCDIAKKEISSSARPKLKKYIDNLEKYNVVYILFPIWWNKIPPCMMTQLEKLDFTDKIVKFISTHEGSGLGSSENILNRLCKNAKSVEGLAIKGSSVPNALPILENWIQ